METLSPCNSTQSSASPSISSFSTESSNSTENHPNLQKLERTHSETNIISHFLDQNAAQNNSYEYLTSPSFEKDANNYSDSNSSYDSESIDPDYLKSLSLCLKNEIEKMIVKESKQQIDEKFINNIFNLFYSKKFKVTNFRAIQNELIQSNVIFNQQFLALVKLGHECFKIELLSTSECLLKLALTRIDTPSLRLKMATLSTLSACYWRQSKYSEAIECMHAELDLATQLGNQSEPQQNRNLYSYNRFRIYGNLASAHQRLGNLDQCMINLQHQLNIAVTELRDTKLSVNALNSIGILHLRLGGVEKCRDCLLKSLQLIEKSDPDCRDIELQQLNLLGEFCLKQCEYLEAREFFMKQLCFSTELKEYLSEASALLNLAFISTKLKLNYQETSSSYYERCLLSLNTNFELENDKIASRLRLHLIELYGKCYIGLVNGFLAEKDIINASLYSHSMLDFTLKQMQTSNRLLKETEKQHPKLLKYLKFMEMNACSKLAVCYTRQNRLNDAIKLHEREATIALELNNILYLTRAYSHLAQLLYIAKNYDGAVNYYKLILSKIEANLLATSINPNQIKDERLIQMIYFTLSNIGYCMEALKRMREAKLMFEEQLEMANLIQNENKQMKFKATALLNLVNLSLNGGLDIETDRLMGYLKSLLHIYEELSDFNGQLFATQCLAFSCHRAGNLSLAIEFYIKNIELATNQGQTESLCRSLFNASLCYKAMQDFTSAYKFQMDYYNLISKNPTSDAFSKFVSLGLIADCAFEIDKSIDNCQRCLQIHVDRLNSIKSQEENNQEIIESKKSKLIFDCLESISKIYSQMHDPGQVLKFKKFQLELLKELQNNDETFSKQNRCKLWLDVGSLLLFIGDNKEETDKAIEYFELVLEEAFKDRDLLLESLAIGNLGMCRQKQGDLIKALELFQRQKYVLEQKSIELKQLKEEDKNHREIISIRIDIARTNAKIAKCYQSIGKLNQVECHLKDYIIGCELLHNEYFKFASNPTSNSKIWDLIEQIYIDYDISLAKLSQFYMQTGKVENAIDLNELRLKLLSFKILDSNRTLSIQSQTYSNLAQFYSHKQKNQKSINFEKSLHYCEKLIDILQNSSNTSILLAETLLLHFDLVSVKSPAIALNSILKAYKLVWVLETSDLRCLRLKYAITCRLCFIYQQSSRILECLETLMDALSHLTNEFQVFEDNQKNNQDQSGLLVKYIEYLFLIHRRIALIHMGHSIDPRGYLLSLKHVNESLVFLNYQKEFHNGKLVEFRLASVYYMLGICHKYLKNNEMELEMFANSLDLYESLVQMGIDLARDTQIRDKLVEEISNVGVNYEEDEETVVKYSERVEKLYQLILDALIRMKKIKEALLVVERYRAKLCTTTLGYLPEFLNFEQIDNLINDDRFHAIIYFSYNEINCSLNCWLLKPFKGIVKFEKIEAFDKKVVEVDMNENDEKISIQLEIIYDLLIKPMESELDDSDLNKKSIIWIVYDEYMFKLPFHLAKKRQLNKSLYERFEVNCIYSLKYLSKSQYCNQIFTKKKLTDSGAKFLPMKVISSEEEMNKLLGKFNTLNNNNQNNQQQFDLLLLLVNPEHKNVKSLNTLVNTLISRKITKSVLVEFTHIGKNKDPNEIKHNLAQFEQNANSFLKSLYSNMLNRTNLNSTLVYNTLISCNSGKLSKQRYLLNYLLFGSLGLNAIKNIIQPRQTNKLTLSSLENNFEDILSKSTKEESIEDIVFELTINDTFNEITFSQVINQYLNLSNRIDNPIPMLNLTISILQDFLDDKFGSKQISLTELFEERITDLKNQYKTIAATRLMLKRLGFRYYIDSQGKCMIKLPEPYLEKKLKLILRCLSTFEEFSSNLVKELFELSKNVQGRELFILMKQHQLSSKSKKDPKITLVFKEATYTKNKSFLNEFTTIKPCSNKDKIELEADYEIFNNLVLIETILLNDFVIKEAENSLENYVEVYFKEVDEENIKENVSATSLDVNDDEESQYSNLSTILGIQVPKSIIARKLTINLKEDEENFKEIKIYRELDETKINTDEMQALNVYKNTLDKVIGNEKSKNNDTFEHNKVGIRAYDNYIFEMCHNKAEKMNYGVLEHEPDLIELELKSKNLLKLEEKEYMNQIITTTTTVNTLTTNEDLFLLLDNAICDNQYLNDSPSSFIMANSNNSSKTMSPDSEKIFVPISIIDQRQQQHQARLVHLSQNIYSCLTNYGSNNSKK